MNLHVLNLVSLVEAFFYANTPIYLYTRFRRDSSVQKLAQENDTRDIVVSLRDTLANPVRGSLDGVIAYALLVSLSHKPASELGDFGRLQSSNLEWFDKIKSLVLEDAPKESRIEIAVP